MKKNFTANLFFLVVLNLLIKPIYIFGIEVGIQNSVGPAEYGLYYAMFNFTFLFNVLLDMGINNFQKIKVAQHAESGIANMASLVPLKMELAAVYMLVTVVIAMVMGFDERYWFFIGWLMLNHVLSAFLLLLRANLSGLHLFLRDSIVSVIDRLLLVVGIGYVLWFGKSEFQIEWFALAQTGAYVVAILSAVVMLPAGSRFPKLNFSWEGGMQMLRQTWPFALLILLMTAYNKLDGVMIERLAADGLTEAGIYAQAYRLIDAGNSFAFLYAGMLLPVFARLYGSDRLSEINSLINQGIRFLVLPAIIGAICVWFYGGFMMDLLYDQMASESALSFTWLMGSFICICLGYVFGTLLTAANRMREMNIAALLSVIANVGLNFFLIPTMGAEGAAIASFISLSLMAVAQLVFVFSSIKIGFQFDWLWRTVLVAFIATVAGYFIVDLIQESLQGLMALIAISALTYGLLGLKRSDLKTALPE
ncbi:MAG: polysaccharide biosynthesis C-terminal domain-containing protein [Flavobacteriales bacterium]